MSHTQYFQIYDEIYSRRDTAKDVAHLCQKNHISGNSALDFGCGTGLYTRALIPQFDKVIGHDIDLGARAQFQKNAEKASFVSDLNDVALIDAVFSFFNVFNYLSDEKVLNQVASRISSLLRKDGYLVFDLLNADAMGVGVMSKTREVPLKDGNYIYHQKMEVFPDRKMNFIEAIELKNEIIYSKINHLKLWNQQELTDVIGKYLRFNGLLVSDFISNNQIRLCFKKEDK